MNYMLAYIVQCVSYLYALVVASLTDLNEFNNRFLGAYNGCEEEEHYNSF